jgi:hypothetical protein
MTTHIHGDDPAEVARATQDTLDPAGDAADQAERLSMVMESEAIHAALRGQSGEGSLDGYDYPLEDTESVLAMEDAEDASDDPLHAGGLHPEPWLPAEQAAMHVIDPAFPDDPDDGRSLPGMLDDADPGIEPFDGAPSGLTPEDETLLGIDPYA